MSVDAERVAEWIVAEDHLTVVALVTDAWGSAGEQEKGVDLAVENL